MVRYWRAYRPHPGRIGGMAAGIIPAAGHLPEAGGYGDQAAIMLDAFEIMSAADRAVRRGEGSLRPTEPGHGHLCGPNPEGDDGPAGEQPELRARSADQGSRRPWVHQHDPGLPDDAGCQRPQPRGSAASFL